MVRIINSYAQADPLAKVISDLGNSMFGDTLTPELKKQKLGSMQREEYGIDWLAKQAGAGGILDANRAAEAAVLGGLKPDDLAALQVFLSGNQFGPRDTRTTNAMAGAGKYKDSAQSFDIDQGNQMERHRITDATQRYNVDVDAATAKANNAADNDRLWNAFLQEPKPALDATGKPIFVPQGNLTGGTYQPIPTSEAQISPVQKVKDYLTAAEVALPGASPEQKRAWVLEQVSKAKSRQMTVYGDDGKPIVEFGGEGNVGDLTNANQTQVQRDLMSAQSFDKLVDETSKVVEANPNSVGAVGNVRGAVQSARIAAQGFAQVMGVPSIDEAWQQVQADAIAAGVKPETLSFAYDPSLSEIETLYKILAFQGIRTIGGQSGNDASDRDFKNIMAILGDPNSWMTNSRDLTSKMKVVKRYVRTRMDQNRSALSLPPLPANTAPAATNDQSGGAVFNWSPEGGLQ